jgi:hypothetical protein
MNNDSGSNKGMPSTEPEKSSNVTIFSTYKSVFFPDKSRFPIPEARPPSSAVLPPMLPVNHDRPPAPRVFSNQPLVQLTTPLRLDHLNAFHRL